MQSEQNISNTINNHEDFKCLSETDISGSRDQSLQNEIKRLERELFRKEKLIKFLEKKCAENIFKSTQRLESKISRLERQKDRALEEKKNKLTKETSISYFFQPLNEKLILNEMNYNQLTLKSQQVQKLIQKIAEQQNKIDQYQSINQFKEIYQKNVMDIQKKKSNKGFNKQNIDKSNIPKSFQASKQISLIIHKSQKQTKPEQILQICQKEIEVILGENQIINRKIKDLQDQLFMKNEQIHFLSQKIFQSLQSEKRQKDSLGQILDAFGIDVEDEEKNTKLLLQIQELKSHIKYVLGEVKKREKQLKKYKINLQICESELCNEKMKNDELEIELGEMENLLQKTNQQMIKNSCKLLEYKYSSHK